MNKVESMMQMHKLLTGAALALALLLTGQAQAADGLKAGQDYAVINPAVELPASDKVQVVELFWYGCPACYNMEPHLVEWLKTKPENVEFVRLPAIFNNPQWALHARAYYTAESLGVVEDFHAPFFHAMHRFGKRMDTPEALRAFFAEIGVSGEDFDKAFLRLPGEENLDVMDALLDSSIRFVTRHEQGAGFMADVYGRLTGRAGVCLSTLGPGATNLITGVADANMDHAPLVAIAGQASTNRLHKESHQVLDLERCSSTSPSIRRAC
jgi:thiol-disulfide isomerase/thioredoxin